MAETYAAVEHERNQLIAERAVIRKEREADKARIAELEAERNELRVALENVQKVACGEDQVADDPTISDDDTGGMTWIYSPDACRQRDRLIAEAAVSRGEREKADTRIAELERELKDTIASHQKQNAVVAEFEEFFDIFPNAEEATDCIRFTKEAIAQRDALRAALEPFARVAAILESLPESHRIPDGRGIGPVLPQAWPKMGDLRRVAKAYGPLDKPNAEALAGSPVEPTRTAEDVARQFHEVYERLAPQFGYKTREASAKPWDEVPVDNKRLMIAVATEVMGRRAGPSRLEGLRRRVHHIEGHNQDFERCESAWCHPTADNDPAIAATQPAEEPDASIFGSRRNDLPYPPEPAGPSDTERLDWLIKQSCLLRYGTDPNQVLRKLDRAAIDAAIAPAQPPFEPTYCTCEHPTAPRVGPPQYSRSCPVHGPEAE